MSLMSKIATIDASIKAMKNNLGVSESAPLEEVVDATASGGGGGGAGTPGVYKVATIEERDAIAAKEGDTCIVQKIDIFNYDGSYATDILYFPQTITAPTVVTASASTYLKYGTSPMYRIMYQLSATGLTVRDYYSYNILAQYSSTDGSVYTRTTTVEEHVAPQVLEPYSSLNANVIPFIFMKGLVFEGIFSYKEGAWGYTDIGLGTTAENVIAPNKVYTNSGTITGTRDLKKYRENYIHIQETEPESKTGIWCKPQTGLTATYDTSKKADYQAVSNLYKHTKLCDTDLDIVAEYYCACHKTNNTHNFVGATITYKGVTYQHKAGIVVNNVLYIFLDKTLEIDLNTGVISEYAFSFNFHDSYGGLHLYNNHIYSVQCNANDKPSSITTWLADYDISTHTGTYKTISHNNGAGALLTYDSDFYDVIGAGKYLYFMSYLYSNGWKRTLDRYDIVNGTYSTNNMGVFQYTDSQALFVSLVSTYGYESTDGVNITYHTGYTCNPISVTESSLRNALSSHPEYEASAIIAIAALDDYDKVIKQDVTSDKPVPGCFSVWTRNYEDHYFSSSPDKLKLYDAVFYNGSDAKPRLPIVVGDKVYVANGTGLYVKNVDELVITNAALSIELDQSAEEVQVEQNLYLPVSNVFCYAGDGTNKVNIVKQLYKGDGTSWTLYKTYGA